MIRIIDDKDTGKTRKLLNECSSVNGVFVCRHPERVRDKCLAYNIPFVETIGYNEFIGHYTSEKIYFIDELDDFVNSIITRFGGYSLSVD